ncbi:MAG: hypothetical protein J6L69_07645 [Lachnospiraceae bacterium]|nr:hypothetical protein [Lachnospiraceae bacterium]
MLNNVVEIIQMDKRVSVKNNDVIVNCNSLQDAKCCTEVLDTIFNKGEVVVSIDYMDFINKSGTIEYDLELTKNIVLNNYNEYIRKIEVADNCKCIICLVGNINLTDATKTMEKVMELLDKHNNLIILYGLIYDEKHQENEFDLYIWKEVLKDENSKGSCSYNKIKK